MFEFHTDRQRYFEIQYNNAKEDVIPFIKSQHPLMPGSRVLEIGCGEGGVLAAFVNEACTGVGVELDELRLQLAHTFLKNELAANKIQLIAKDIYLAEKKELGGNFDLIILKDVIEHIHDQKKLLNRLHDLLLPGGAVFFGFPPWQMPFGGHQQICKNKLLSKLPYYHLLPRSIYKWLLTRFNEPVNGLLEVRDTRISIEGFERMVHNTNYKVINKKLYLINPIYKYKFGWKAKEQLPVLRNIPYIRNFFTTCVYYLITRSTN